MEIITKKVIKSYVTSGAARDITNISLEEAYTIGRKSTVIALSRGTYGMTGAILKNYETGELYAITTRNTILFAIV